MEGDFLNQYPCMPSWRRAFYFDIFSVARDVFSLYGLLRALLNIFPMLLIYSAFFLSRLPYFPQKLFCSFVIISLICLCALQPKFYTLHSLKSLTGSSCHACFPLVTTYTRAWIVFLWPLFTPTQCLFSIGHSLPHGFLDSGNPIVDFINDRMYLSTTSNGLIADKGDILHIHKDISSKVNATSQMMIELGYRNVVVQHDSHYAPWILRTSTTTSFRSHAEGPVIKGIN